MNNIKRIQTELIAQDLDAILITDEKNQRYATGFPFTDGAVLVSRDCAWLLTDSRYIEAAHKAADECAQVLLFDKDHPLMPQLKQLVVVNRIKRLAAEEEKLNHKQWEFYERLFSIKLLDGQSVLKHLRMAKTDEEIEYMIAAQRISEQALVDTLPVIKPGISEKEIMAELVYNMLRHGAEGNSFDPIVITGKKTSLPHGVPGEEIVRDGDFVTMDFGCLKYGYCSDMTRTVAVGHATDEMKNIYSVVLEAQLAGIAAARAGIPGKEIDAAARKVISDAGYGKYFGHGFGHSLGLDIHEWPNANPTGNDIMPVGAVVSAEPGIYLEGRFGVRIEDVMVLKEDGCRVITKAPKNELIIL